MAYDAAFFDHVKNLSYSSASAVLPLVHKITRFNSVIDVGCGVGTWLAAASHIGVQTMLGIDGDYVDRSTLLIDERNFIGRDLAKPISLPSFFDLAISVEVAEHLPDSSADGFIRSLCSLSDVVLFSAAVPGQQGREHTNEQWPDYWERKFGKEGFRMLDCIRPRIWEDDSIAWWYRQNLFLCFRFPERFPELERYMETPIMCLVHPDHPLIRNRDSILESLRSLRRAIKKKAHLASPRKI